VALPAVLAALSEPGISGEPLAAIQARGRSRAKTRPSARRTGQRSPPKRGR
jgi:hypothetical protein